MNHQDSARASGSWQANSTPRAEKTAYQAIFSLGTETNLHDPVLAEAAKDTQAEIDRLKELLVSISLGRVALRKMCLAEAHLYHRAINSHYRAILNVSGPQVRLDHWRLTPEQREKLKSRGFTDTDLDRCYFEMLVKAKRWSPSYPTEYPKEHSKKFMAFLANIRPASPRNWTIPWARHFRWEAGGSAIGRMTVKELVDEYTTALVEQYIPNRIKKLQEMQAAYDCVSARLVSESGESLPSPTVGLGTRRSDWYYDREKVQTSGVYVDVEDYVPSAALRRAATEILGLSEAQIDERLGFYRTHAKIRIRDVAHHELAIARFLFRDSPRPKSQIGCAGVVTVEDPIGCTSRRAFLIIDSQTADATWTDAPETDPGYLTSLERAMKKAIHGDLASPIFDKAVLDYTKANFIEEFDAAREKRIVSTLRYQLTRIRSGLSFTPEDIHDHDVLIFQTIWLYIDHSEQPKRDLTELEIQDLLNAQSGRRRGEFNH